MPKYGGKLSAEEIATLVKQIEAPNKKVAPAAFKAKAEANPARQ